MSDVGKVQGPAGPPENLGRREKASADADKFKQAMRRRVTEVSKVDPDEQKKRKRREEAEEEEPLEGAEPQATPPGQVTPFSLEEKEKKVSPLEMQKAGPGISPTQSAQPTQKPPTAAFFQAPSPSEMEDDSGVLEEESFMETLPSSPETEATPPRVAPQAQPPLAPPSSAPILAPTQLPEQDQQPSAGKTSETPPPQKMRTALGQPSAQQPATGKAKPRKTPDQLRAETPQPPQEKEKSGFPYLEESPLAKTFDTEGFFEQMVKGEEKPKQTVDTSPEELAEEEAEMQGVGNIPLPPPPSAGVEESEKAKEKEIKEAEAALGPTSGMPEGMGAQVVTPPPLAPLSPYSNLDAQVRELFDRMVGVMTVMNMSGMTETTITLNAPQFASSVFFGTQIIIQEFSTAPQAFNIQLNGPPRAIALLQGNNMAAVDDLMAAFQAGNYNFRVNRLEIGHLTERPLFKRKEKTKGQDKDQTGEHPQ